VPEGTRHIECRFAYAPYRASGALFDNMLDLSLFGPQGARGIRHNCGRDLSFIVAETTATPGYLPGAIETGTWTLVIDCHRVLGPEPITYRAEITLSADHEPQQQPRATSVADRGAGWYRGDLHAHSDHSDASWTVADWAQWARKRQLDFATLSDHNTISGHAHALSLASDDLLVLRGNELTTHYGHALTVGDANWQEWRANSWPGVTMPRLASEVMHKGALFIIAHPEAPGDPACTGCHWDFKDMMPGNARIVEIWNGGEWSDYNEDGLRLFRSWLDFGYRLVATAGSDIHGSHDDKPLMGFNHVRADSFTPAGILSAIKRGENYLSSGPKLVLEAKAINRDITPMGGACQDPTYATLSWSGLESEMTIHLFGCGTQSLFEKTVREADSCNISINSGHRWLMAELRDSAGLLRAVTNPVFLE
jgi:hypothetical protein